MGPSLHFAACNRFEVAHNFLMNEAAEFATPRNPTPIELQKLSRWRVSTFWVMLIGYIGYYLIRGNLPVALPLLSREFGYSNLELGKILTFSELAYAFGKFTMGPYADRIGGRKIFLIGMVGGIIANFLFPLHPSIAYFTAIWCLARFFLSMGWGGIIKTIGEWYEPERNGMIMGLISVNFQFGGVLASLLGGLLIGWGVGWKGLFYWPAIITTVITVLSYFLSKSSPAAVLPGVRFGRNAGEKKSALALTSGASKSGVFAIMGKLFRVPLFRQVLVFSFFIHILRSFFLFWIPKFMVDLGMGNVNAAFSSAVFPLAGVLGTVALGWYTDRYAKEGNRSAAMWKMLLGSVITLLAIGFLVPFGLRYQAAIIALLGLSGFFIYGPYSMSAGCLSLDIAGPEGAGTCTGLLDGVGYIGGAVAAWGTGALSDAFGWREVFFALAFFSLVTVVWVFYMSLTSRKNALT
ncbi:MAG: MFS transporter [Cryobacterium sp.]|nr:MFS transporter [Oligoflexia bacterium]